MGDWFKQILLQGFIIGVAAALLVYLPWGWARIVLFVLLAYVLLMMGRNPLFFYRQIIRGLALASVLILGVSGHFTGALVLPNEWGALSYVVELGGSSPGWFVLALGLCAAADFAFAWFQERKNRNLIGTLALDIPVTEASAESVVLHREFPLTAPKEGLVLTGASLRIGAFGRPEMQTQLSNGILDGPEEPVDGHLKVEAGELVRLIIDARAGKDLFTKLLSVWLSPAVRFIFPVRGRLELLRGTESSIRIPVRLTRQR